MASEKDRAGGTGSISSPEQLSSYLRVMDRGIWALLTAIIALLAVFFIWAALGRVETFTETTASVKGGTAQITLAEKRPVAPGMTLRIGTREYIISGTGINEVGLTVAYAPVDIADGTYDAKIITESVAPISFLIK